MFLQLSGRKQNQSFFLSRYLFIFFYEFVGLESKLLPLTHQRTEITGGEAPYFIVSFS